MLSSLWYNIVVPTWSFDTLGYATYADVRIFLRRKPSPKASENIILTWQIDIFHCVTPYSICSIITMGIEFCIFVMDLCSICFLWNFPLIRLYIQRVSFPKNCRRQWHMKGAVLACLCLHKKRYWIHFFLLRQAWSALHAEEDLCFINLA